MQDDYGSIVAIENTARFRVSFLVPTNAEPTRSDSAAIAAPFGIKKMIEKRQSSTFTYNSKDSSKE